MSVKGLLIEDTAIKARLHFNVFAGQISVIPIVEKIGDSIALDRNQAHLLYLYLKEHLNV